MAINSTNCATKQHKGKTEKALTDDNICSADWEINMEMIRKISREKVKYL